MKLAVRCLSCDEVTELEVSEAGFRAWKKGQLIQLALPELSAAERELLISETCGPCFDNLFEDEE